MHDAKESIKFWSELWGNLVDYDRNAEWIMAVEKEVEWVTQQGNINIPKEDVYLHLRKMPNCKALGPDGLHEFWLKKITSLHLGMVKHLHGCIQTGDVPTGCYKVG